MSGDRVTITVLGEQYEGTVVHPCTVLGNVQVLLDKAIEVEDAWLRTFFRPASEVEPT